MKESAAIPSDKRRRFPPEISGPAVWLSFRCARSYRDGAERRAERGVRVTAETIRRRCRQFGQGYATAWRRRPHPGDAWPRAAVFVRINGDTRHLWRAVDQHGNVLARLVQARRAAAAATKSLRKRLTGLADVPRVVLTAMRASHGVAMRAALPRVAHRRHKGRHHRAANAHQPTRERHRPMRRCTAPGHAPRFLAAHGPSASHSRPRRRRLGAAAYRATRHARCATRRSPAPRRGPARQASCAASRLHVPATRPVRLYLTIPAVAGILPLCELAEKPTGATVVVGRRAILIRRPPTGRGTCFVSLEDETALAQLMLDEATDRRDRAHLHAPLVIAEGTVQRRRGVVALRVVALRPLQTTAP